MGTTGGGDLCAERGCRVVCNKVRTFLLTPPYSFSTNMQSEKGLKIEVFTIDQPRTWVKIDCVFTPGVLEMMRGSDGPSNWGWRLLSPRCCASLQSTEGLQSDPDR